MKIVMFRSNRESSAIIQQNTLSREKSGRQVVDNSILANGYTDRLLWEEAAALKIQPKREYHIPGNWQ